MVEQVFEAEQAVMSNLHWLGDGVPVSCGDWRESISDSSRLIFRTFVRE